MKPQSVLIYIFLFAAMIGINNTCKRPEGLKKPQIAKTEVTLQSISKSYEHSIKQYQKANEILSKKLSLTDSLLKAERKKLLPVHKKMQVIVKSNWNIPDKEKLEKCDSLKELVTCYEYERIITDSLTEEKINSLTARIILKDQIIFKCDSTFQELKTELEKSVDASKACFEENEQLTKQNKRRRFFNKVFGTVAAAATVVTSTLILTNSQ